MTLLLDLCRCHDVTCPDRLRCERFLQASTGTVYAMTLRAGIPPSQPCPWQIPAPEVSP